MKKRISKTSVEVAKVTIEPETNVSRFVIRKLDNEDLKPQNKSELLKNVNQENNNLSINFDSEISVESNDAKIVKRFINRLKINELDNLIKIDDPIISIITQIADNKGFEVYLVGGYVRDYYLDRNRTDLDFTVVGDALAFAKLVAKEFKVKPVIFERFTTAMVPISQEAQLEFVGTRKEEYLPNSRKPIVTIGTLYDDLARRDFTVNAMAVSINAKTFGQVIDKFNGLEDIQKQILRTPLDPEKTFEDDPLRMLRAARFASQLNFSIEDKTIEAIIKMYKRLKIISQERISSEFFKILESPQPSVGINILSETGLLSVFFPQLEKLKGVDIVKEGTTTYAHKDVFYHSLKVLDNISKVTNNVWLRFAALLHDIAKPQTKRFHPQSGWSFHGHEDIGAKMMARLFRDFKLPLDKLEYVEKLVRLHQRPMMLVDEEITDSAIRRLAVQAGDALEDLFILCKADITTKNPRLSVKYLENYDSVARKIIDVQEKDKLREFQSPVRGEEIMEYCKIEPCKAVGIIKTNIEEAILDGKIQNDYDEAKQFFVDNINNWLASLNPKDIRKSI
jgi:putative nucleotidyltransferase with HDIG domain